MTISPYKSLPQGTYSTMGQQAQRFCESQGYKPLYKVKKNGIKQQPSIHDLVHVLLRSLTNIRAEADTHQGQFMISRFMETGKFPTNGEIQKLMASFIKHRNQNPNPKYRVGDITPDAIDAYTAYVKRTVRLARQQWGNFPRTAEEFFQQPILKYTTDWLHSTSQYFR
ncbi:MAG: hypothetical protein ACK5T0_10005 [Vampirovibrionales bacterium]